MSPRTCKSASSVLVLFTCFGLAACDNDNDVSSTSNLVAPSTVTSATVTVEPAAVPPVFLSSPLCFTTSVFQTSFSLVVRADRELLVNGFGFEFLDRFGTRSVPIPIPIPTSTTGSNFVPVPLPSSSPIPIPGSSPFDGLRLTAGSSRTLPFLLQFGCGVPASGGTLFVSVNTASRSGAADVTRVSLRIVG